MRHHSEMDIKKSVQLSMVIFDDMIITKCFILNLSEHDPHARLIDDMERMTLKGSVEHGEWVDLVNETGQKC
jgi:hypothetical protein